MGIIRPSVVAMEISGALYSGLLVLKHSEEFLVSRYRNTVSII